MAFPYNSYYYGELLAMGLQQLPPPPPPPLLPPPPAGYPRNLVPQTYRNSHNFQEDFFEIDKSDDEKSNGVDDSNKRTLFCANLDGRVTEELLYEVFLQAGPVERAHIPKDANGRQRSFGFITYVHKCTIPYALRLYQGLSLFRRTLVIKCNDTTLQKRSAPSPSTERDMYRESRNIDNNAFRSNTATATATATTSNFNRYNTQSQYDRRPYRDEKRSDWTRGTAGHREFNFRRNNNSNSNNNDSTNNNRDKRSSSKRYDRNKRRSDEFQKHLSNSGRYGNRRYYTQQR